MASPYVQMTHEEYKAMEAAMRAFKETTHTSVHGFYHKSVKIPIGAVTVEFHGPIVKAAERQPSDG